MSLEEIKCIKVNGVVMLMSLVLFGAWEKYGCSVM